MKKKIRFLIVSLVFFMLIISVSPVSATIGIMPLGDSITRGVTGSSDDTGYRRELFLSLVQAGYQLNFVGSLADGIPGDFDDEHEGHSGFHADGSPAGDGDDIFDNVRDWLIDQQNLGNPTDIVLLHIGTNDISVGGEDANEVDDILDEIYLYDPNTWVILARIINRVNYSQETTDFNNSVATMVQNRINLGLGDKLLLVDMENGAGIIYSDQPGGDMVDDLHPNDTGYPKMANVWFPAVQQVTQPVADAGPAQSVLGGNTVTLDGSNSTDPDGDIETYLWQQTGGDSVVLSGDQTAQATFTAPSVGPAGATLTFSLTVTDDDGFESTDNTSVFVKKPVPPVADAGPNQSVLESDTTTLDGSNSTDPDGNIMSYLWQQTGGVPVVLSNNQAAVATFAAPSVGNAGNTLTFSLKVTDDDGLESTDNTSVTVKNHSSSSSGGGGGGGCFIATASYGSPMEPHVKVLPELRDYFLVTNFAGETFVKLYHVYSRAIANFISKGMTVFEH